MAGKLTTHVLDTARGCGAAGLAVTVRRLEPYPSDPVAAVLDEGGRATLMVAPDMTAGIYEILFQVGAYHRGLGVAGGEPAFLDDVPVRFGIADPESHYHVPLVMSPFGYSTYRGG